MKQIRTAIGTRARRRSLAAGVTTFSVVATVGIVLLQVGLAAGSTVSVEVEDALANDQPGGVQLIEDTAASGTGALLFGTVTGGPVSGGDDGSDGACTAPSGLAMQDVPEATNYPWKKTGAEAIVYFDTSTVGAPYDAWVSNAAAAWSVSPCVEMRVAETGCSTQAICVTMTAHPQDTDAQGNMGWTGFQYANGYLTTVHMDLYVTIDQAVLSHEMGHAIGHGHRTTEHVLMNHFVDPGLLEPDDIELQNLLVLYANQQ
ncbi:hypothetical protein JNJ66_04810 [Candidatus Saccharibacteria bacterium]|nr:hypothetical protein [Candidatus Saccharibacteria bacterium]